MNREIKFRGQIPSSTQWVYGYYVVTPKCEHRIYLKPFEDAIQNTYYVVNKESIGQFTGFKDFNGNDIYEGDILEYVIVCNQFQKYRSIVEFDSECGGWYLKNRSKTLSEVIFMQHNEVWKKTQNYLSNTNQQVKVTGNVFDNTCIVK